MIARGLSQLDGEVRTASEHLIREFGVCHHVKNRVFHSSQPPVHLEGAGRDVAADKVILPKLHHGKHQPQEFGQVFGRETISENFLTTGLGQRESRDLIETELLGPFHSPEIHVRFAFTLVNDTFHRVVVIDPGLPNVIPHGLRQTRSRYLEESSKPLGGLRMKPHKDRNTIDGFPSQRCMDALFTIHFRGH